MSKRHNVRSLVIIQDDTQTQNQIITMQTAVRLYRLPVATLRKWSDQGCFPSRRSPGGVRLFRRGDLDAFFGLNRTQMETGNHPRNVQGGVSDPHDTRQSNENKEKVLYARVSSAKQRGDLTRQIQRLKSQYPSHRVISDIGSGINFKRKGLQTILDLILSKRIGEIVVAHRDRLCRFGFDIFEYLVNKSGGRIVVAYGDKEEEPSDATDPRELAEDLMAIIHVFSCRQMGRRRHLHTQQPRRKPGQQSADGEGAAATNPTAVRESVEVGDDSS